MRAASALPSLLVLVILAPYAVAQTPDAARRVVVDDAKGDVHLEWNGQRLPAPLGYEDVDLISAWVGDETPSQFKVGYTLAAAPTQSDPRDLLRTVGLAFRVDDVLYSATLLACDGKKARLMTAFNPDPEKARWIPSACLDASILDDGRRVEFVIPKQFVVDGSGSPIRYGGQIDGLMGRGRTLVAYSPYSTSTTSVVVWAVDRVPDNGWGPPFPLLEGFEGFGSIEFYSPQPIRFSNGESTTIVYSVILKNHGSTDATILLEVADVPQEWSVRVPPRVKVNAGGSVQIPAILAIGFGHGHGSTQTFALQATLLEDGSGGSLRLGMHFPEIPQPAGHHPTLHLHSKRETSSVLWMNALEQDPDPLAKDEAVYYSSAGSNQTSSYSEFQFPLNPGLRIGLDFEPDRPALATIHVVGSQAAERNLYLRSILLYCDPQGAAADYTNVPGCISGGWQVVAEGRSDVAAVPAGGRQTYEFPLKVRPEADILPYRGNASNLMLLVRAERANPTIPDPSALSNPFVQLLPEGSTISLPLLEYHDPIDQAFTDLGSLRLTNKGGFERPVNAGRVVVFPFKVENQSNMTRTLSLEVEGHNKDWARWSSRIVSLPPMGGAEAVLVVEAPDAAAVGERAELFAVAQDQADPATVAIARLRALVVEHDVPDERGGVMEANSGPIPGSSQLVTLLVVGMAGVALRRRILRS